MKQKIIFLILLAAPFLLGPSVAHSDDEWEHHIRINPGAPGLAQYREECGSCHLAYPSRFLSKSSWTRIMNSLDEHFGENAELGAEERGVILRYLSKYSAPARRFSFWRENAISEAPVRITSTPGFLHEHDEIPARFVKNNPKVGSLGNCGSCHPKASDGSFNEHAVRIPGVGRWDD